MEAVELYKEGWAPRIYLFRQIADWGEALLVERDIPNTRASRPADRGDGPPRRAAEAIDILDQANSTAEEATHVLALVDARKILPRDRRHLEAAHAPRAAGHEPRLQSRRREP